MIELFDSDKRELKNRKSSKGNQLKWEKNGVWYKADYTGYEGLSEYVISHLLMRSSLKDAEYVVYRQEEIKYKNQIYMGVASDNFLSEGSQLITLERLFTNTYGIGLNKFIYGIKNHEERLCYLVSKTEELTGLRNFGEYMAKLLTIDSLFLNEDRHTHNIAIVENAEGSYEYCPLFDQGGGLLSDTTMDYPLTEDVYTLIDMVKPKTFCQDFDEQLEIAEKLYGHNIKLWFTHRDVEDILADTYGYEKLIINRVRDVIFEMMRRYNYLFK